MDRQIEVTGAEFPPEPEPARKRDDARWTILAAGALGMLIGAAAVFLLAPDPTPSETTTASTDESLEAPARVVTTRGPIQPPPSLAERVPGLTSDLVAFGFTPSGQAVIQQWFINATEPRTIEVPFGFAIPDQSGRWIAALAGQRYGDSFNLHVGNGTYQEAIATDVGSVVWSVDEPGRIAWTERTTQGVVTIDRRLEPGAEGSAFELPVSPDTRLVWLDGDRLTFTSGGSIVTIQPDGTEVSRLDDAEFVTATDGWALVRTGGGLTLVDGDLVPRAPLPHDGSPCVDARFGRPDSVRSTPLLRLALVCGVPDAPWVEVLEIEVSTLTFTLMAQLPVTEPETVSWLDGDRFVAVAQPDPVSRPRSTIKILDVETGAVTDLQWPGAVLGVIGTR